MPVVWIHGAFGVGKSSVAAELQRVGGEFVVFDPELVGYLLRGIVPVPSGDFQDLPQWRELVVATAASLHRHGASTVVAPMTLLRRAYFDEIVGGLRGCGVAVVHVLLDASDDELRRRITCDTSVPDTTTAWRLAKLDDYRSARPWLSEMADLVIDTEAVPISQAATMVLDTLHSP